MELFSTTVLLLFVLDPFGNVPLVLAAMANIPAARRSRIVLRECLVAYVVLVGFMLGGKWFLRLLQLSEVSLSIAGGIILFLIALRMVFHQHEGLLGESPGEEPFIVPIAVPWIAGPSALATVMLMASRDPGRLLSWIGALTFAMVVTTLVLLGAPILQRVLGQRGIVAVERLMGLVLTAIAVQMLLNGVREFAGSLG